MKAWQHRIRLNACECVQMNAHLEKSQAPSYVRSIMTYQQAKEMTGPRGNVKNTNYVTFVSNKVSVYVRAYSHTVLIIYNYYYILK